MGKAVILRFGESLKGSVATVIWLSEVGWAGEAWPGARAVEVSRADQVQPGLLSLPLPSPGTLLIAFPTTPTS